MMIGFAIHTSLFISTYIMMSLWKVRRDQNGIEAVKVREDHRKITPITHKLNQVHVFATGTHDWLHLERNVRNTAQSDARLTQQPSSSQ